MFSSKQDKICYLPNGLEHFPHKRWVFSRNAATFSVTSANLITSLLPQNLRKLYTEGLWSQNILDKNLVLFLVKKELTSLGNMPFLLMSPLSSFSLKSSDYKGNIKIISAIFTQWKDWSVPSVLHTIMLISHASKVMLKILQVRLQQ